MPAAKKPTMLSRAEVRAHWNAYFAGLNPTARRAVQRLLTEIRALSPGAVPVFSYRIPGFRLHDRALLWCAGFGHHASLYPITANIQRANAKALADYKTSTGTVQFPLAKPLPLALARRLIRARVAELMREAKSAKA
jgi:uncharacterized protein YdhG (YjbR/CyaY superfamily)